MSTRRKRKLKDLQEEEEEAASNSNSNSGSGGGGGGVESGSDSEPGHSQGVSGDSSGVQDGGESDNDSDYAEVSGSGESIDEYESGDDDGFVGGIEGYDEAPHHGFGMAVAKILSKDEPEGGPILPYNKELDKKLAEEKAARKATKLKALERHLFLNRNRDLEPTTNNAEKEMVKIATKGVVQLFNAVAKHQGDATAAPEPAAKRVKGDDMEELSRSKFLALLKGSSTGGDEVGPSATGSNRKIKSESDSEGEGGGARSKWAVLRDDLVPTDLLKESESESEADEGSDPMGDSSGGED